VGKTIEIDVPFAIISLSRDEMKYGAVLVSSILPSVTISVSSVSRLSI
jgi:hypothetical protein